MVVLLITPDEFQALAAQFRGIFEAQSEAAFDQVSASLIARETLRQAAVAQPTTDPTTEPDAPEGGNP